MRKRDFIRLIKDSRGMTLLEVVFASVILLGAIIIMLSMFETSITMLQFTTSRSLATQIANEEIENIRSRDYDQVFNSDVTTWPDDPDLDDSVSPPLHTDIDDSSSSIQRTVNTSTAANGIQAERVEIRRNINFWVRNYVLWVDDATATKAYKRIITKVLWGKPNPSGKVVMATNFAQVDFREPRPSVGIIGVWSTNFNYFKGADEGMMLGDDDSIRGGTTSSYDDPIAYAEADYTNAKASYVDRVEFALYNSSGTLLTSSSVASGSVDGQGRFPWPIDSTDYSDGQGYLIRAEAFDDLGASDVDMLRVRIDNTNPAAPFDVDVESLGLYLRRVTWDWTPAAGDPMPEVSRFLIFRNYGASDWRKWAAISGDERFFLDTIPQEFTYRVWAIDAAGNVDGNLGQRAKSNDPTVSPDTYAPDDISSATVTAISWKTVEVNWDQVSDDSSTSSGVAGYEWWSTDGSEWMVVGSTYDSSSSPITWFDPGLKPGKTYHYRGLSFDWVGNPSDNYSPTYKVSTPQR